MNDKYFKTEKEYNYDELQRLSLHSKKYFYENDKKSFLKQIPPIEQKMILMSSSKPYEVLNYLDVLDIQSTKLMLEQLKDDEIRNLLNLFTPEDKKQFYATFSQAFLVNRFIEQDTKFFNYIPELNLDRKIELMDNSTVSTIDATKRVYESVDKEDKKEVIESVTSLDGSFTLNNLNEVSQSESTNNNETIESDNKIELVQETNELNDQLENKEETNDEEKTEEPKEEKAEDQIKEESPKEEKAEDQTIEEQSVKEDNNTQIEENQHALELFQEAKNASEQIMIDQLNNYIESKIETQDIVEPQKSL